VDGRIGFESTVGQGSKFWVELPVADEIAAKAARAPSLFATPSDTRCKILYIEDKIPNVELMRAIVEDLSNTRFIDAQTVEEGLKIARFLKPDVVIPISTCPTARDLTFCGNFAGTIERPGFLSLR
jgi:hypothetical protein